MTQLISNRSFILKKKKKQLIPIEVSHVYSTRFDLIRTLIYLRNFIFVSNNLILFRVISRKSELSTNASFLNNSSSSFSKSFILLFARNNLKFTLRYFPRRNMTSFFFLLLITSRNLVCIWKDFKCGRDFHRSLLRFSSLRFTLIEL